MGTPKISPLFFVAAAFFGAIGQYFYKSSADPTTAVFSSCRLNRRLLSGVVCYVAVMALFVAAFEKDEPLTMLCPIHASTFRWSALIAWLAYGTPIRPAMSPGCCS